MALGVLMVGSVAQAAGSPRANCLQEAQLLTSSTLTGYNVVVGNNRRADDFTSKATAGDDVFCGRGGNDSIATLDAGDIFIGGAGDDYLHDFQNNNGTFYGGAGNDYVFYNYGTFDGGDGTTLSTSRTPRAPSMAELATTLSTATKAPSMATRATTLSNTTSTSAPSTAEMAWILSKITAEAPIPAWRVVPPPTTVVALLRTLNPK
jgi:hypothetical protein